MALRVLLADESSTIKKVFQLALQDFAVEVQTVNLGVDVAQVAESFRPDIIFADVLLQKKSGYEVSSELKADPTLSKIPFVLMWSSFMDIDEDKMQASQADGRLEKPFDVKALRKIIESFVPRTKEQKLSGYLSFPKLPAFEEKSPTGTYNPEDLALGTSESTSLSESAASLSAPESSLGIPEPTPSSGDGEKNWNMESFDPLSNPADDQFEEMSLKSELPEIPSKGGLPSQSDSDMDLLSESADEEEKEWEEKDINKYKVHESSADSNPTDTLIEDSDPSVDYFVDDHSIDTSSILGPSGNMEPEIEVEIEMDRNDQEPSLPSNIEAGDGIFAKEDSLSLEPLEANDSTDGFIPEGKRRGETVVLSLDELEGKDATDQTLSHQNKNTLATSSASSSLDSIGKELSDEFIKEAIGEQAKEMIEAAVWQILPDLATSIIERELKKLLDENETTDPRL